MKCHMIIVMFEIIQSTSQPVEILIQECLQTLDNHCQGKKFLEIELFTISLMEIEQMDSNYIKDDKDSMNIIVKEMKLADPGLYRNWVFT